MAPPIKPQTKSEATLAPVQTRSAQTRHVQHRGFIFEFLLNNTDTKIIVYSGALDLLVNTAGTRLWMEHLKWKAKDKWKEAAQEPFSVNSLIEGYVKKADNLILYIIFRAGHSVPIDNMMAFREMLLQELVYSEMPTSILNK
ncbi:hypothetical protein NQ317_008812 [Molorchus minor]|uniref:Serine carboxypeptidase n=1 Tax=Molorchus minor TaxID=1323400 RepID=A0ABQ9J1T6_9CUCU|nr:hypothetical protein NQ317_008812 [Molorchus minor]